MRKRKGKLRYLFLLIVILGLIYFLLICLLPRYSIVGQLLRQEHAVAEAQAQNIQTFVNDMGNDLISVSKENDIVNPGLGTNKVLKSFVDRWGKNNIITGISITDKEGVVIYNHSNISPMEIGTSLADRDYFIWAKDQIAGGHYIVGASIIARYGVNEGRYITPLAVPIFRDGVFSGMLASAIRTSEMTEYFLSTMNISGNTDVFLLGKNGYILFNSRNPEDLEINISEAKQNNLFLDNKRLNEKIYNALAKEKDGSLVAKYKDSNSGVPESHAIAYYPVIMPGRHWLVVLATPVTEVTKPSIPTYVNHVAILMLLSLTMFITILLYRKGRI